MTNDSWSIVSTAQKITRVDWMTCVKNRKSVELMKILRTMTDALWPCTRNTFHWGLGIWSVALISTCTHLPKSQKMVLVILVSHKEFMLWRKLWKDCAWKVAFLVEKPTIHCVLWLLLGFLLKMWMSNWFVSAQGTAVQLWEIISIPHLIRCNQSLRYCKVQVPNGKSVKP